MSLKCFIYIRVSTDEQKKGYSPDNQIRQCKEYAKLHDYQVKGVFDDSGRSGRTTDRPELQRLLATIEEERIHAILIYKIDRFARNVTDFSRMYNNLKEKGIKLLSINEGDLMEGNSLIPNIFASVAQWESEVNSQRTKDALMQKFRTGWQPTPPPIGYRSLGGKKERKTHGIDPNTGPIIREMFEVYATGEYSIFALEEWLKSRNIVSKNGTLLGHSVINTILNNPFYYGLIRWNGQSKMGKHKRLINKDLFEACQYVLAKHRNFLIRRRKHNFLLRGFLYCSDCGLRYTAEWHESERFKNYDGKLGYYHCSKLNRNGCPSPYVEMSVIEEYAEQQFKQMQFSQKFINLIVAKAREKLEESRRQSRAHKQAIINQQQALEHKRNRLEDALLDGTIEKDTFKRKHKDMQEKLDNLVSQLETVEAQSRVDVELIEEVLSFARNVYQTYKDAPPYLKRHYLRFFFEKLMVKNKEIVEAKPTPFFLMLQENHSVILTNTQLPG
jgi:site-specific DNA recombinase